MKGDTPFCVDARTRRELSRFRTLVRRAGFEPTEGDALVLGVVAGASARLQELAEALADEKDQDRRVRLIGAERLARQDFVKQLELLDRSYAARDAEGDGEGPESPADVLPFPRLSSVAGQRVVAAVTRSPGRTKDQLQRLVRGSKNEFLKGLREAMESGLIERVGSGRKNSPYKYRSA